MGLIKWALTGKNPKEQREERRARKASRSGQPEGPTKVNYDNASQPEAANQFAEESKNPAKENKIIDRAHQDRPPLPARPTAVENQTNTWRMNKGNPLYSWIPSTKTWPDIFYLKMNGINNIASGTILLAFTQTNSNADDPEKNKWNVFAGCLTVSLLFMIELVIQYFAWRRSIRLYFFPMLIPFCNAITLFAEAIVSIPSLNVGENTQANRMKYIAVYYSVQLGLFCLNLFLPAQMMTAEMYKSQNARCIWDTKAFRNMGLRYSMINILGLSGVVTWFWCVASFNLTSTGWHWGALGIMLGCFGLIGVLSVISFVKSWREMYSEGLEVASPEELEEITGVCSIAIPEVEHDLRNLRQGLCFPLKKKALTGWLENRRWLVEQCNTRLGTRAPKDLETGDAGAKNDLGVADPSSVTNPTVGPSNSKPSSPESPKSPGFFQNLRNLDF